MTPPLSWLVIKAFRFLSAFLELIVHKILRRSIPIILNELANFNAIQFQFVVKTIKEDCARSGTICVADVHVI